MSPLLAVLLAACAPPADDTASTGGSDTADTGGSDTEVVAADCSLVRFAPRTTSWNGGEEVELTLDCAAPEAADQVTVLLAGEARELAITETTETTLKGTFTTPTWDATGPVDMDVEVDGEHAGSDTLRFRLDLDELDQKVGTDDGPDSLGWPHAVALTRPKKSGRVIYSTTDDFTGAGVIPKAGEGDTVVYELEDFRVEQRTDYEQLSFSVEVGDGHGAVIPVVVAGEKTSSPGFVVGFEQGEKLELQGLDGIQEALVDTLRWSVTGGDEDPSIGAVHADFDEKGLKQLEVIFTGVSAEKGEPTMLSAVYTPDGAGGGAWKERWKAGMATALFTMLDTVPGADGTNVGVVWGGDAPAVSLLSMASGKELERSEPGVGELAAAASAVTEKGGLLVVVSGVQGKNKWKNTAGTAEWDDLVLTGELRSSRGDFDPTLGTDPGAAPLELRTTEAGEVVLAGWSARTMPTRTVVTYTVVTWVDGDLSTDPGSVQVVSRDGRATLDGSSNEPLAGLPGVVLSGAAQSYELGAVGGGSAELVLSEDAGWRAVVVDGGVYVRNPDGEIVSEALAIDPTGAVGIEVQDELSGYDVVVLGSWKVENDDGSSQGIAPSVVTLTDEGGELYGTGYAQLTASSKAGLQRIRRDLGFDNRSFGKTHFAASWEVDGEKDESAYTVAFASLDDGDLPGPGESLVIELDWEAWPTTSAEPFALYDAVLPEGRLEVGDYLETPLGEQAEVTRVSDLSGEVEGMERVVVAPWDGEGCPLATWYVPVEGPAAAVVLDTADEKDCSDLLLPVAVSDLDGRGAATVSLLEDYGDGTVGLVDLHWDGIGHLTTPPIILPEPHDISAQDLDGDGLDELYVGGGFDADGEAVSGLLLRPSNGLRHLGPDIRKEVINIKNASRIAPPTGNSAPIFGGNPWSASTGVDVATVQGSKGRNFTTVGVANQSGPIVLHSWGAVLD